MTRLYSFDALKVLSIYMVIVGHVLFYSFHEANNLVWQFIDVVNMPMFMFISGFFSGIPTAKGVLKRLRTRVRDKDCVKNRVKRAKIVRFTLC